jgi:hypothetical protein
LKEIERTKFYAAYPGIFFEEEIEERGNGTQHEQTGGF